MGKLNSIILNCKIVLKRQRFIAFITIVFIIDIVLIIKDVETSSSPYFFNFIALLGIGNWLHADIVE